MTTAPPPVEATEVCRLTVDGPAGRADLAVPVTTTVSALLPVLLRALPAGPDRADGRWVLQRLGDEPLDPGATPATAGLRHGDVLHLRPAGAPLPVPHFDDLADGVADRVGRGPGRWRPGLTRALALVLAGGALAALAAALLGAGAGPATAARCAAAAAGLTTACAVTARMRADRGSVLLTGVGALWFVALAGLTLRAPAGGHLPGATAVLAAAGGVVALAALLLGIGALPLAVPGTALVTGVAAACGAIAVRAGWAGAVQAAAVLAVALFVLGHLAPRLALRAARLRVPHLPRDADELQCDIEPEPGERLGRRVTLATAFLDTIAAASALVQAAAVTLLVVLDPSWAGWLLPLTLGAAQLLRARGTEGTLQRVPALLCGAYAAALVLVLRVAPAGPAGQAAAIAVLLAAAALLPAAAWRLPRARLLPIWGHLGDLAETVTAIALLPLVLQVIGVYARLRALAG
ncbi:type VII secretion integral membrane protein EccD [Streptomyces kaniharaensis]|uniref:Type VII secretion integral membrane protein EccD n=1 Tax=Streptomyces kaniharaensis TaxID=212423 RepID=A0A6N7L335_9ACTN|nr:type VII secretion integral membrane protein EccD [Streptomyces kaniharaensis]MQS16223.1 type VII secretion integral membrane protein EccD [Streptomyces kaniharaensis]